MECPAMAYGGAMPAALSSACRSSAIASIVTAPCCGSLNPRPVRSYTHTVVSAEAARRTRTHSRTLAPSAAHDKRGNDDN